MDDAVKACASWIESFVIGHKLCPFASIPFYEGRLHYSLSKATNLEALFKDHLLALNQIVESPRSQTETSFLVIETLLEDFHDYLDFVGEAENSLEELGLEGIIQIASFHPDYHFAGTNPEDPENFSNRSPLPMLHYLREDSVTEALEAYPHPEQIPERNISYLKSLGSLELEKQFQKHRLKS